MIHIQLPAAEAERLDTCFRSTDDRRLRDRLQIVLMAHRGRARQHIATDLGIHRRTVTRWLNAYCADGLDGLRPRKAKGMPGKIPAAIANEIRQWDMGGQAKTGPARTKWTSEARSTNH